MAFSCKPVRQVYTSRRYYIAASFPQHTLERTVELLNHATTARMLGGSVCSKKERIQVNEISFDLKEGI